MKKYAMNFYEILIICTIQTSIYGVSLEDALVDLRTKWDYKFKISSPKIVNASHLRGEKVFTNANNTSNRFLRSLTNDVRNGKYDGEFTDYLADVLKTLLMTNDSKLMTATNAAMEHLKNINFTIALEKRTQNKLRDLISSVQKWSPFEMRGMLSVLRGVMNKKDYPIYIKHKTVNIKTLSNYTVFFRELLDVFDTSLPKSDHVNGWNQDIFMLEKWKDDKNGDIKEIMKNIVKNFKDIADRLDHETAIKIDTIMKYLLKINK